MVPITKVKAAVARFAEVEVCSQMSGLQKFLVATGAGVLVSRLEVAAKKLPLGLCKGEEIDVEAIYQEAKNHMESPIPVSIPGVGTLSFTRENLDTLYAMIMG